MRMHLSSMAAFYILMFGLIFPPLTYCQNVGIGTPNPQKLLSVNGSILLDQGNTNFGTLDSAGLKFGTLGGIGISSKQTEGPQKWNLSFWTNNQQRLSIMHNGNVGIGTTEAQYKLTVNGGTYTSGDSYVAGDGTFAQSVGIGGFNNTAHKLRVSGSSQFTGMVHMSGSLVGIDANLSSYMAVGTYATIGTNATIGNNLNVGNDGIIDGNFRVNGRVGINGPTQSEFKLIVNDGNSYFQGNIASSGNGSFIGTVNAAGDLIIKGKGHVRSNGTSNLRIGFDSKGIQATVAAGGVIDLVANITSFDGGNQDIRVSIAQFDPDPAPQYVNWTYFDMKIYDVDAANDQCRIRIWNRAAVQLTLKGTLYLTTVAKD